MEGRTALWFSCLLVGCAGCVTGGAQKTAQVAAPPSPVPVATTDFVDASSKKDSKRTPRVLIAFAKLKEGEAKALDQDPEQQFKIRHQARELYQEALKLDGSALEAHRGLGRVYVDLGDFARAQETFTKAQVRFPKESIFWFELGQMHNRKKDFVQSVECYKKALELDPENRLYLTTLGFTLARAGQIDQSITLLAQSMGPASAHYNVARMLLHLQQAEQAAQHLQQSVRLNPNLEAARQLLSDVQNGKVGASGSVELPPTQ
jgi:tetratricopeptide (TPR) repeat protein